MTKLPQVTSSRVLRVAKKLGYSVRMGSKHIVIHDGIKIITIIPRSNKPIKSGTLKGIIKDLGLTVEDFRKIL